MAGSGASPPTGPAPTPEPPTPEPPTPEAPTPAEIVPTPEPPTSEPPTSEPPTSEGTTPAAPTPAAAAGLPAVVAVSGSFCTPTNRCPVCYGDCDEDSDCEDGLICGQRDGGDPVPGCSGGELSTSGENLLLIYGLSFVAGGLNCASFCLDTDYCVDPNATSDNRNDEPQPTASPPLPTPWSIADLPVGANIF